MSPLPRQGWLFLIEFLKWYFSKYWQVRTRPVFAQTVTYTREQNIGWGRAGSHEFEVAGKGYVFTNNREMTTIGAIFNSTCHTKKLNPWPNSSASSVVIHCRMSVSQEDGAI